MKKIFLLLIILVLTACDNPFKKYEESFDALTAALTMADNVMTYKLVVKEIAAKYGVYASFMPKPLTDAPGSGMHIHQSLFDSKGNNAFFDSNDLLSS